MTFWKIRLNISTNKLLKIIAQLTAITFKVVFFKIDANKTFILDIVTTVKSKQLLNYFISHNNYQSVNISQINLNLPVIINM